MGNLTTAFIIVVMINIFLFFGQTAILDINPQSDLFYNNTNTLIDKYQINGSVNEGNVNNLFEGLGQEPVEAGETTNIFTDTINAVKSWFLGITGLDYLLGVINAPYNFLKALGLPQIFVSTIGTAWYILTIYLIVAFIKGGGGD